MSLNTKKKLKWLHQIHRFTTNHELWGQSNLNGPALKKLGAELVTQRNNVL
ncbi:hypothetical protein ALT1644_670009 [Alteromonas macleodii]